MNFSALLFDLDGTLVNSIDLYGEAVKEMFAQAGVRITDEQFRQSYATGMKLKDWIVKFGLAEEHVDIMRPARDTKYVDLLRRHVTWLPGAKDMITALKGNYPLGLVTGSWQAYVDAIDERLGVSPHFRALVTAEDVGNFPKPHPHGLLLAADRLGVEPEQCLYVGDQLFDVEAAKAAGMASCCIRGAYTLPAALEAADNVVDDIGDVMGVIGLTDTPPSGDRSAGR